MNREAILDTVTRHMLWQGKQSINDLGCRYLTDDGLKCAIGFLIPEDHPGGSYNGYVLGLFENHPDLKDLLEIENESDISFLYKLQIIHDVYPVEEWKEKLAKVNCG